MVVDHFKRRMKLFLLVMSAASIVIFALLGCIQSKFIHLSAGSVTRKNFSQSMTSINRTN